MASVIGHYQRKMSRHAAEPDVLVYSLNKLAKLDGVSIAILQDTGIGRAVNGLKKHDDNEVRRKRDFGEIEKIEIFSVFWIN